MSEGQHPFEAAGLGVAPFRVVDVENRVGPIRYGNTVVGAPGQPMGACDYCGRGIAQCFMVKGSDGSLFTVGCDCVRKTNDKRLVRAVNREKQAQKRRRQDERISAARELLETDGVLRLVFEKMECPNPASPAPNALEWAEWMMRHAGYAGKMGVTRKIEKVAKGLGHE